MISHGGNGIRMRLRLYTIREEDVFVDIDGKLIPFPELMPFALAKNTLPYFIAMIPHEKRLLARDCIKALQNLAKSKL